MKKTFISLSLIIILALILPIISNKLIEQQISKKIELLNSNGIEVKNTFSESSYISTTKYYKCTLKDTNKAIKFMQTFVNQNILLLSDKELEGMVIVIEMKYSNIPIGDSMSIDIYPLLLPTNLTDKISKENPRFYKFITKTLDKKTIFYHINSNLLEAKFNGYMKNINESYTLDNGREIRVIIDDFSFNGEGMIASHKQLNTKIKNITFTIVEPYEKIVLSLKDLYSQSSFKLNGSLYAKDMGESLLFEINKKNSSININGKKVK